MFCSKCGFQNSQGEIFCKQCGTRLDGVEQTTQSTQSTLNQFTQPGEMVDVQSYQQPIQNTNTQNFNQVNSNPNLSGNIENHDAKKWAILSVVIPVIAIVWYIFIGLSPLGVIVLVSLGFGFAQMGEPANKKLSLTGKILSGILAGMGIVMFAIQLFNLFS